MKVLFFFLGLWASVASAAELTIYNDGLAFVQTQSVLSLESGRQNVVWDKVTEKLIPESVMVTLPSEVSLISQEYLYNLVQEAKLLSSYLGKKIFLDVYDRDGQVVKTISGTLLSSSGANVLVLKTASGEILLDPPGRVRLPKTDKSLLLKPCLRLDLESPSKKDIQAFVDYLTRGLSWKADYVAHFDKASNLSILGWITVRNNSGNDFDGASVKVVAGHVNLNRPSVVKKNVLRKNIEFSAALPAPPKKVFSYYVYEIPKKIDLKDRSTKQLVFLRSAVSSATTYRLTSDIERNDSPVRPRHLDTVVTFSTEKPLPEGTIRFYKDDVFLGESFVPHTPKGEDVVSKVGEAFDVVGYHQLISRKRHRAASGGYVTTYNVSVTVKNKRKSASKVEVYEKLPYGFDNYEVHTEKFEPKKVDFQTLKFTLDLKPGQEETIKYWVIVNS